MNATTPPPQMDPWAHGVRAADVPIAEGSDPNPLEAGLSLEDIIGDVPAEEPASDIDTRKITVTFIKDHTGQDVHRAEMTLPELAAHIGYRTAASKMTLPWLKLAMFGNKRSDKNSLRTNENVLQVSGLEGDHDSGELSFDDAVAKIRQAGIRALLYTSASYVPGIKERWRIIVPLSQNREPEVREKFVARVNGLLDGKLAGESFTLSQGYLYGHVDGAEHRVEVIDGDFIDRRDDLYAGSIFKDGSGVGAKAVKPASNGPGIDLNGAGRQYSLSGDDTGGAKLADWQPLIDSILAGEPLHTSLRDLAAKMVKSGMGNGAVVNLLRALMEGSKAKTGDPVRWMARYDDIPKLVDSAEQFRDAGQDGQSAAPPPTPLRATPYVWRDPKDIPKREFLYGTHLIRKFGSAKFAAGGVGKSILALTEAIAMATGRPLLGTQPRRRCRVWYWNGEDPREETERRIAAICLHHGIAAEELVGWLFYDSGRDQPIVIAEQARTGSVIAKPVVKALIDAILEVKIDVLIIDPFVSCHRIVENDNPAMDMVAKQWTAIADQTNTAIELIHHTKKTGGADATVEDGRGAVALLAAVRSAQVLNKMTPDEGTKAGVDNYRQYFKVENGKANLAPPPEGKDWFHIVGVKLDNGNGILEPGDSVGVVTTWQWPNPLDGITGASFEQAAYEVRKGRWRESIQAKDWVGRPIAKALKLDLDSKSDKAKVAGLIKIWIGTGSLIVVEEQDEKRMLRKFVQVADAA